MAIIYSYPTVTPTVDDLLLGTDVTATGNPTKNFTIESLITLIQGDDRGLGYVLNQSGDARFVNPDGSFGPNQSAFNLLNLQGTGSVAFGSFSTVGGISIGGTIGSGFSSITSTNLTGALLSTGQAGQIASSVQAITQNPNDNSTRIATTEYVDSIVDPSILTFTGATGGDQTVTLVNETFSLLGTTSEIKTASSAQTLTISLADGAFGSGSELILPNGASATTQGVADNTIKVATTAFVKQENDAQDLDFSGTAGTGSVILGGDNAQVFAITGTADQTTTTALNQGLAIALTPSVEISGTFTGATFAGDLLGTINTATTGVTQAENNNTNLIATTAFVERAATAKTLSYQADAAGTGTMPFTMNLSTDDLDIAGGTNINTSTLAVTTGADPKAVITVNLDDAVTISGKMQAGTLSDGTFSGSAGTYTGGVKITSVDFETNGGNFIGNALTSSALDDPGAVSMTGDAVAAGVTYTNGGTVPLISTISDSVVTGKILGNSFNPQTGSVQATDSILEALEKLQGQVTNLPQGLVYQGIWSAAGTGGGTPDLTVAGTKVNGHFYICDTAGSAAPNGTGTTPNDWDVRDWVIFADDGAGGGVDEWQKIDNSSLAGGSGTTNTITKWTNNQVIGNSSMTDDGSTITIADTVDFITQGNNTFGNTSADASSFLGNVTLSENLILEKGLALDSSSSVPYGSAGQVLTSGGNINIANTWTTPTIGTVTSVGYTHQGNAFTVGGVPVTSSGVIAVTMAGSASQYINGAGNLTTFPTVDNYDYWTLSDDTTTVNISSTNTAKILGGTGITSVVSAADKSATIAIDTIGTDNAIAGLTAATPLATDTLWFNDISDSNTIRKATIADIVDLGNETLAQVLANGNGSGANNIAMADNQKITFGASGDLEMFHDTSNSYINTTSGSAGDLFIDSQGTGHDLYLQATDDVFIRPQGGEDGIKVIGDGAVELYHNGSKKLETTGTGITVSGQTISDAIVANGIITCNNVASDKKIAFRRTGANNFSIEHDSAFIYFYNETTSSVIFKMANNNDTTFTGNVEIDGNLTVDGNIIHGNHGNGGTYNFSDTVNASSNENIFSIEAANGAQAFTVYFTCNTTSMSVAKVYTVVHAYGGTPIYNKLIDSGPYGGEDFTPTFTGSASTVTCNISNLSTSINANIVTTVVLGGSPTALTVTAL